MKKIITILFLAVVLASCSGPTEENTEVVNRKPVPVRMEKVLSEPVSISIESQGRLTAGKESQLSFKINGIVARLLVNEGEEVKRGQLLATLDLAEINAQVDQAVAGYEKSQRDLKRLENLYDDQVITLESLQNGRTAFDIAKSKLEIARFNRKYATIIAPEDGQIIGKYVEENELVNPGNPVFRFASSEDSWIITSGIIDRDVVRIEEGDSAHVYLDAFPGQHLKATVDLIPNSANPINGTYEVEIKLDETLVNLRNGFYGKVSIFPSTKQKRNIIPLRAVIEGNGREAFVYEPVGDSVSKHKVMIEEFMGEELAVIMFGPSPEYVVTEGVNFLKDNSSIQIIQ